MFSVGLQYYAPTTAMPMLTAGSYGVNFSATLPWLWGKASRTVAAEKAKVAAAVDETADVQARVATEVASVAAQAEAQARRYQSLRDGVLPTAKFAVAAASEGYAAGGTNILPLLMAIRSVVDTELAMVDVRSMLDHAMVELDWAAGAPVKRAAIAAPAALAPAPTPSTPNDAPPSPESPTPKAPKPDSAAPSSPSRPPSPPSHSGTAGPKH
jgi:outer membrane protein TolC